MRPARRIVAIAAAFVSTTAVAGPPYLTDDPVPTDPGHWEIYPFAAGEGRGSSIDADVGLDLNYGAARDVQLTATLPLSFSHGSGEGWRGGTGDAELGVKYRVIQVERSGVSVAIFPRAILPTAARSPGARVRFLLPVWAGKDLPGGTSLFGGGGYTINPGAGNLDYWQAAIAVNQELSSKVSIGAEITHQGPDVRGETAQTRAGAATVIRLSEHYALLFSAGPTWADHGTSYHFYSGLGLSF